jgi:hypothetical protein
MASFYDSASIITIPSGYKAGTLYSAKPTDGTGDMAFTRTGDTATRVNSAGIIERCITNLALQSNNFSNAIWTNSNVTIAGSIADPNGGTTAFSMAGSSSTSNAKNINQNTFAGTDIKTFSVYAKANTHSFIQVRLSGTDWFVNFNLTNGTFQNGANAKGTMTNLGNGWYRCQMTTVAATANSSIVIQLVDSLSSVTNESSTTTNSVYIWRAQAQFGDQATNYIDTTTAAVTEGPVTNLPRLDYFGSTCPQLLMEPTRTNLLLYSQMIDNSAWGKDAVTASGNVLVSPDGYANADIIVEDTALGNHRITRAVSFVSGTTYASSCFVKQGSGTRRILIFFGNTAFGSNLFVNFNIQTGTITPSSSSITGKIENYGNGWFRCIAIATATSTNSATNAIYLRQTDAASSATYTGDGTSSMYIWGLQCEAGAYATSYIPTTAATVTRNLDECSKIGISDLIGQTEGTLFYDMDIEILSGSTTATLTNVNDGSLNNRLRIVTATSSRIRFLAQINGGVTTLDYTFAGIYTTRTRIKIAIGYKSGDSVIYINGIRRFTSASTLTISSPLIANSIVNATEATKFNQVLLFKTRLTNDQLATLTTL